MPIWLRLEARQTCTRSCASEQVRISRATSPPTSCFELATSLSDFSSSVQPLRASLAPLAHLHPHLSQSWSQNPAEKQLLNCVSIPPLLNVRTSAAHEPELFFA